MLRLKSSARVQSCFRSIGSILWKFAGDMWRRISYRNAPITGRSGIGRPLPIGWPTADGDSTSLSVPLVILGPTACAAKTGAGDNFRMAPITFCKRSARRSSGNRST